MRPTPFKQEPHHFIKRWPRSRRQKRPVADRIEWVVVVENDKYDYIIERAHGLALELKAEISKRTPKGWMSEALTKPEVRTTFTGREAWQKIRFFKPASDEDLVRKIFK